MDREKHRARILRFLSRGPARLAHAAGNERLLFGDEGRGTISVDTELVAMMLRDGCLKVEAGQIALMADDRQRPDNRRDLAVREMDLPTGMATVAVNLSESPLAQLMRRKNKGGKPFLDATEFQAGERLRADYTRGQIMPRLGANWEASVSSGARDGGIGDLTDAALAARLRVENAICAVGPELSGVLIDVCCFLKGMETVEIERGWPVRSAKIVLKTALGALSRHYNPRRPARERHVLHWGASDYRPSIT